MWRQNQEESFRQEPNVLATWSQTLSFQNCRKRPLFNMPRLQCLLQQPEWTETSVVQDRSQPGSDIDVLSFPLQDVLFKKKKFFLSKCS